MFTVLAPRAGRLRHAIPVAVRKPLHGKRYRHPPTSPVRKSISAYKGRRGIGMALTKDPKGQLETTAARATVLTERSGDRVHLKAR